MKLPSIKTNKPAFPGKNDKFAINICAMLFCMTLSMVRLFNWIGARFDVDGYCVAHPTTRLCMLTDDGKYKIVRKVSMLFTTLYLPIVIGE